MTKRRDPGDGSLSKRADGSWVAALWVGNKRVFRYAQTKETAKAKLEELRKVRDKGATVPKAVKLGDYLDDYLAGLDHRNKPSTMLRYRHMAAAHIKPALGHLQIGRITPFDVSRFSANRMAAGLAASTVRNLLGLLRAALDAAVRLDMLSRNPVDLIDRPKSVKYRATILTQNQARHVLEAADRNPLGLFIRLALLTGARYGELAGMTWANVDLDRGELAIRQTLFPLGSKSYLSEPKTASSRRTIPIGPTEVQALRRWRSKQAEARLKFGPLWADKLSLVFTRLDGQMFTASTAHNVLRAVLKKANEALPEDERIGHLRVHDLRHSATSFLISAGVSPRTVADLLGHAQISTTLAIYSQSTTGNRREASASLAGLLDLSSTLGSTGQIGDAGEASQPQDIASVGGRRH